MRPGRRHTSLPPVLALIAALTSPSLMLAQGSPGTLSMEPCKIPGGEEEVRCGTYTVYENRDLGSGRTIDINIMVIPAATRSPRPDPIVPLSGGPGEAATVGARGWFRSSFRWMRDIVLVDQRGTGKSNPLYCEVAEQGDLQSYLDPVFTAGKFERCRERLEPLADLTQYTTPIFADDLHEILLALGYEQVNLTGGSYGTRAALVYMRRYPETVRTAILDGVAPIAFRNPLYHAYESQKALEKTFEECAADPDCHAAFPDLEQEFAEIIERLEREPAIVTIAHPETGEQTTLSISRYAFAEALRTSMYYLSYARTVPLLIHRAYEGDYGFFVDLGLRSNIAIVDALAFGMLLSVTCPEDLSRIDENEIPELTDGTFLGDDRVRNQLAACSVWPARELPDGYGEPLSVEVPTLLLSGTLDPVTPPRWGAEAASHLPNSLHLVVPAAHGARGSCIRGIRSEFLEKGSLEGLDTSCVSEMSLPPFNLTGRDR
ncbi:MAG: alpha/beta fold hydrolase [Gemmatimonadota bacterium]|nr:MAG: alpha/beta fold hydrolase [Gemmatimonadota bacterium]